MATTARDRNIGVAYTYDGELKRALDIAEAYGFRILPPLKVEACDREHAENYTCPEHHIAALKHFDARQETYPDGVARIAHTHKVPYKNRLELRLEILGDRESSAEGLLFQAAHAILQEYGHKNTMVTVNSVGGKETLGSFTQSVGHYFRARINELDPECRNNFKKSVFAPLRCTHEACLQHRTDAPHSLNFLTEQNRQHFKEVLEYLEAFELPYAVDPHLVGSEHYTTRTVYSITSSGRHADEDAPRETVAWGERYDHLAKRIGLKKVIPAVNITLDLGTRTTKESFKERSRKQTIAVHIIHAGRPAKMRVLKLAEFLRTSHIRVSMHLHKNSVTEQLERAQLAKVPLLIIVGQKEVLDGTVMIRHAATSSQESVPLSRVATYLKSRI
ncbi:MAG: His/Gly/Thr/Pro-type tRNA ligase C-terminal domain-containing protein [Patescibacteria group bacterium]